MKQLLIKLTICFFLVGGYYLYSSDRHPEFLVEPYPQSIANDESFPVCRPLGEPIILSTEKTKQSHSPSITELSDGRLFTVWYAGTREGAKDVKIWYTTIDQFGQPENDGKPQVLLDRATLQRQTKRTIRKLGNPLVYSKDGRLYCWVVSVSFGGWSASSLNCATSDDNGRTWTPFRKMRLSPLFNLSNLVRSPAVPMTDGCLGLPVYHELVNKYSYFLILDSTGKILRRTRIPTREEGLQPTIAATDSRHALALMRNGTLDGSRKILAAETDDAGQSWRILPRFPLSNPDSGISIVRTKYGKFILAANPEEGRIIQDLYGADEKNPLEWSHLLRLDADKESEFSYPSLCIAKNGTLNLVYTWKRLGIKYCRFQIERTDQPKEKSKKSKIL